MMRTCLVSSVHLRNECRRSARRTSFSIFVVVKSRQECPMFSFLSQRPVMWQSLTGAVVAGLMLAACNGDSDTVIAGSDGPASVEAPVVHAVGDINLGKQVFRFETFGNERLSDRRGALTTGRCGCWCVPNQSAAVGTDGGCECIGSGDAGIRGTVMPLVFDLARKPNYLHDNTVTSLDHLLNPTRGATSLHPSYLTDQTRHNDMAEPLRGLSAPSRSELCVGLDGYLRSTVGQRFARTMRKFI